MQRRNFLASIAALFTAAKVKAGPTEHLVAYGTGTFKPGCLPPGTVAEYAPGVVWNRRIYIRGKNGECIWLPTDAQKAFAERYGLSWIDAKKNPSPLDEGL